MVARTPSEPVTLWAKASRAAESTTAPPAPPALGLATLTPWSAATAWTAESMRASTALALVSGAEEPREARSSPRIEAPSRVPRNSAAVTWETHPCPRPQVPVTRSAMREARTPEGPRRRPSPTRMASVRTGPKAL